MPVFTTVKCSEGHAPECTLWAASSRAARLKEETGDRNDELDDESLVFDMSMASLQVMTARSEAARPASTGGQTRPKKPRTTYRKREFVHKKTEYGNIPFNIAQFGAIFV